MRESYGAYDAVKALDNMDTDRDRKVSRDEVRGTRWSGSPKEGPIHQALPPSIRPSVPLSYTQMPPTALTACASRCGGWGVNPLEAERRRPDQGAGGPV